jgi:hypothetical protein
LFLLSLVASSLFNDHTSPNYSEILIYTHLYEAKFKAWTKITVAKFPIKETEDRGLGIGDKEDKEDKGDKGDKEAEELLSREDKGEEGAGELGAPTPPREWGLGAMG